MGTRSSERAWGLFIGLLTAALVFSIAVWMQSCTTLADGSTEPDWAKIDVAGDELVSFLDREYESWGLVDPAVAGDIARIRDVVKSLDASVDAVIAGGGTDGFEDYLRTAVLLVDKVAAQGGTPEFLQTMASLRNLLGVVRVLAA